MSIIPSDITNPADARHWLRVNGYSAEAADSIIAEWSGNPIPVEEPVLDASPEPEVEEWEDDEEEDEEEDWEYEDDEEDEE